MAADHRTLQTLAEEGRVEELLRVVSFDTVIETWLRYHRTNHEPDDPNDDPDWWAVELWFSPAWWSDEGRVRDGLLRLIETAGEEELGVVAAGPLEVFLYDNESRLVWVERRAAESERFRRALAQVWVWDLPTDTFGRLERAAGRPLPRPDPRPGR